MSYKSRITPNNIEFLKPNEVFVPGTNETGFHGSGAAGYSFRFDNGENWRHDEFFLKAKNSEVGSPDRIGRWNVYGVSEGLAQGKCGKSYNIITIKRPGLKRSRPLDLIEKDVKKFIQFAVDHPELRFLVSEIGCKFAGYSVREIAPLFYDAVFVPNISLPRTFWEKIKTIKK